MKKKNQKSQWGIITFFIALCMSLPFMTSCKSEDAGNTDGTESSITRTFKVSETNNDDSLATTRSTMTPQTVTRDLGNGMVLVGTLTDEAGSAATRTTTTTAIADGTSITAYVCKSDGIITNVQTVTVSGSSLTVRCPNGSSIIYFLIGTSPSATAGSNISSVTTAVSSANWNYLHASAAVPTSSDDIGTITFHHAFTEAEVTMTSGNGSTVVGGFASTISGIANSAATLRATGTYTTTGSATTINGAGSDGTGTTLSSAYTPFISTATGSSTSATLTITQITFGSKAYTYSSNNTLTFNGIFAQGHKYNFKVTLEEGADANYYRWDAYAPCGTGSDVFSSGNYGCNPTETNNASFGCANCPTEQELLNYLAAGVYWDAGTDLAGSITPSYTLLPNGITYHTGLWVKKGAYTGSATKRTAEVPAVTAAIRSGGAYFFLPAAGQYVSYTQYYQNFTNAGAFGYYWLFTKQPSGQNSYCFRFCSGYADITSEYRENGNRVWKKQ